MFLFGFAKSDKANLLSDEQDRLSSVGAYWLQASEDEIEAAIADDEVWEIDFDP